MVEIRLTDIDMRRVRRMALYAIVLLLLAWLAYVVREIWLPLLIAFLIAIVLDPLVDRMERRGWSRLKGSALIYLAFFAISGTALTLAIPAVVTQTVQVTNALGQYLPSESESDTKRSLQRLLKKAHATPFVEKTVMRASAQISQGFGKASVWVGHAAEGLVSNLLWLIIIPIVAFYALKDFHLLYARLLLMMPREHRGFTQQLLSEISSIFGHYLRGLLIVCSLNAVATAVVLMLYHVPNALALGAISGVLYVVPYFGAALTITIIAGTCLMTGTISVKMTLVIVGSMILLHSVFFDQIVSPRVLGRHVGLHPLLSIIALLIGGSLMGIIGMILAVPFAASIQMVLLAIFPKLSRPIEVPEGEQLHEKTNEIAEAYQVVDELQDSVDVHQTIVDAVDSAEAAPPVPQTAELPAAQTDQKQPERAATDDEVDHKAMARNAPDAEKTDHASESVGSREPALPKPRF